MIQMFILKLKMRWFVCLLFISSTLALLQKRGFNALGCAKLRGFYNLKIDHGNNRCNCTS
jgi:hypothetical protein